MNSSNRLSTSLRSLLLAQLCFTLLVPLARAQTAPAPSPAEPGQDQNAKPVPVETTVGNPAKTSGEIIELSPFEVVSNNKGYYGGNTMSGTRFNTKIEDLASSITVMTKEQMSDFGMLDINDIFLYVAGTEGTGTYTSFTVDRNGSIADNVQLSPTTANRIRGIAPANVSLGNIETMGRVPIDPLSIDAVEVSRGPNANVFGLGNPSGTVNMVPAAANLTKDRVAVQLRVDSYDGFRNSLDVNKVLLQGKLAIRVSGVNQRDGFVRKPSGVDTERYNGMVKYQPFKNTTITGSISYFHDYGTRPNYLPPRDSLSYWESVGKPTWDPVTMTVHINGTSIGPITASNFPASFNGQNTDYFYSSYLGNNRGQLFIDQTGLTYWAAPQGTTNAVGPTANFTGAHYLQTSPAAGALFSGTAPRPFNQPLFNTTPTISDKSIYNWADINLSAPNRISDTMVTTNISVDQMIINTATQTLAAQVAFMREDSKAYARNLIGISNDNGQSGQLTVDINERLLDGTPNPNFLRPYLAVDKPRTTQSPAKWDTSRAQLAYRLDLTEQKNMLKWLGWFQVTGYAEYKYRVNRQYSWRDGIASPAPWIPTNPVNYVGYNSAPTGTSATINAAQSEYRYYVGDNVGNNVDFAPGNFAYGAYPFVWGNSATGVFHRDPLLLGPIAADKTGNTFNSKVVLKTKGGVVQSHLFNDRLITTLGARTDSVYTKFGNPGNPTNAFLNADGTTINYALTDGWAPTYFNNSGRTTNVQFVLRPFKDLRFLGKLDQQGRGGHFLAGLINGLSLNTNRSNSFLPLNPAEDLYRNLLPNPTGTDKSYGLGLNLLDGKLVVRATHYDNYQKNSQNGDASTMAQRVIRTDLPLVGATQTNPPITLQPNVIRWVTATNPAWTPDQINAEVAKEMQMSTDVQTALINPTPPIGTTNDIRSVGTELEVNYNPTQYWTLTASATDTKSINLNVSKTLADWINQRMPVWTTISDPTITNAQATAENNPNKLWWIHRYGPSLQTPQENFTAFVSAPYGIIKAQEGKANPQVRRYAFRVSTNFQLAGVSDQKYLKHMSVGGAFRWEDKGAIGYYGLQALPAIITDLDPNRPIYDKQHYYVDLFVNYKVKLWRDRVRATFALNARNVGEKGRLQPIGAFPDGSISTFRIVDPQQFFFTATFEL